MEEFYKEQKKEIIKSLSGIAGVSRDIMHAKIDRRFSESAIRDEIPINFSVSSLVKLKKKLQ